MTEKDAVIENPLLDEEEVLALVRAREVLRAATQRCMSRAWDADASAWEPGPHRQDYGMLQALSEVAEGAIFQVLSTGRVHRMVDAPDALLFPTLHAQEQDEEEVAS